MKTKLFLGAVCAAALVTSSSAFAQHEHHSGHSGHSDHQHVHVGSALAGVMGDHMHDEGEWMLSYQFMRMVMDGNRNGTSKLSPDEISGDFANNTGSGPATMRIVPTEMDMDMHMLGAMYAPRDWLTLMVMANYLDKEMDHITFAMANADLEIGRFTTESSGWGDTKVAALFQAYERGVHSVVLKAGVSLPTGSIKERGEILNPAGAMQEIRLPYAMQLGSGTYDLEPAVTYSGSDGRIGWGAQYRAQIRLGENSQDYTLGDKHVLSAWGSYQWNDFFANSVRLSGEHEGEIDGRDTVIAGPVQTADPENYGGRRLKLGLGLNLTGANGQFENHALGVEFTVPVYQDLNGPQMERDYGVNLRYQISF